MFPNPPTQPIIQLAGPTIEALKILVPGWEWEPKVREWGLYGKTCVRSGGLIVIEDVKQLEAGGICYYYQEECIHSLFTHFLTPILDWQLMEELLDNAGYSIDITQGETFVAFLTTSSPNFEVFLSTPTGDHNVSTDSWVSRQQAVMQVIIELAKEVGK